LNQRAVPRPFRFVLRLNKRPENPIYLCINFVLSAQKARTVLVVEDETPIRKLVASVLKNDGYNVLEASSPGDAAQLLGSELFDVDLLFADVMMPGMTGPEFATEMLAMRPGLKVVFATGTNQEQVLATMKLAPHKFFLQKPYTADQLREAVRLTLEG
jgi:two-component system cell cycle sensor histidine kinase/response regulator CckA